MRGAGSSYWETEVILSQAFDLAATLSQTCGVLYACRAFASAWSLYTRHTLPQKRCCEAVDYQPLDLARLDGGFEDTIYELIRSRIQCSATLSGALKPTGSELLLTASRRPPPFHHNGPSRPRPRQSSCNWWAWFHRKAITTHRDPSPTHQSPQGSHLAARFVSAGHDVRIVDISPSTFYAPEEICSEFILGNLCDIDVCQRAVAGTDTVLHFAQ